MIFKQEVAIYFEILQNTWKGLHCGQSAHSIIFILMRAVKIVLAWTGSERCQSLRLTGFSNNEIHQIKKKRKETQGAMEKKR
jgi:hypothetical protein